MEKKSIKKNYIYNTAYQVLLLITPLITTPYLARILGADGVGTVSFAESVVSYFTLFATLGISTYGQREISYHQDDRERLSAVFWETKILQILISVSVLAAYLIFAFTQNDCGLYLILSFNIIAITADVVWLIQGMEEFGKIVFRNVLFKALGIVYIFVAVRTKADILKYVFGSSFFLLLSNISLWLYVPRYVDSPKWKEIKPFRNIKSVFSLFIPTIAVQIYTVLDKTMIGLITGSEFENGYYEQAIRISKMVMTVVTSLGTVMIPRIGYYFGRGENEKVLFYLYRGYRFVWFLGIPLCFGLIGTAPNFVPWFFGDGYVKVVPLLGILSFLILAIGINNVTGMQYFIPTKRQNLLTITVIIGAVVNFCSNVVLIRIFQSIGAAIASVVAETVIALLQIALVRNEISFYKIMVSGCNYFMAGGIMLVALKLTGTWLTSSVINTFIMVMLGAMVYFAVLLLIRDSFFVENLKSALNRVRRDNK
ncbi:polysaccharide biosynthesis protein [Oribacterium sp. C9]|uniref:flippase n=1 Tax=Oribacterium sp. C9 TaxID=1943579 RepID=UPI00098EF5DC|nr:flippase [Oribacterium sp. C9]OON88448.1 polysaccharide biosynthesis protein [Oribacterium sp. C9]